MQVELNYNITYEVKDTNYVFLENKKLINRKTNIEIKPTYKNNRIGYYIDRKFHGLSKLRKLLIKPQESDVPF